MTKFVGDKNGKIDLESEAQTQEIIDAVSDAEFLVHSVKDGQKEENRLRPLLHLHYSRKHPESSICSHGVPCLLHNSSMKEYR